MQPSYAKYAWSSAFCTLAVMALVASVWKMFGYGVSDAEPWILVGICTLLIWFICKMVWIMCSPLESNDSEKKLLTLPVKSNLDGKVLLEAFQLVDASGKVRDPAVTGRVYRRLLAAKTTSLEVEVTDEAQARFDRAAEVSGNHSCDLQNPESWIRTYFRLLNQELNSFPFPRYV